MPTTADVNARSHLGAESMAPIAAPAPDGTPLAELLLAS